MRSIWPVFERCRRLAQHLICVWKVDARGGSLFERRSGNTVRGIIRKLINFTIDMNLQTQIFAGTNDALNYVILSMTKTLVPLTQRNPNARWSFMWTWCRLRPTTRSWLEAAAARTTFFLPHPSHWNMKSGIPWKNKIIIYRSINWEDIFVDTWNVQNIRQCRRNIWAGKF